MRVPAFVLYSGMMRILLLITSFLLLNRVSAQQIPRQITYYFAQENIVHERIVFEKKNNSHIATLFVLNDQGKSGSEPWIRSLTKADSLLIDSIFTLLRNSKLHHDENGDAIRHLTLFFPDDTLFAEGNTSALYFIIREQLFGKEIATARQVKEADLTGLQQSMEGTWYFSQNVQALKHGQEFILQRSASTKNHWVFGKTGITSDSLRLVHGYTLWVSEGKIMLHINDASEGTVHEKMNLHFEVLSYNSVEVLLRFISH